MIKINLLPHREEKRKQRKSAFYSMLALSGIAGALTVLLVGGFFANKISEQNERNNFIKAENTKLDGQIKEIATLKQEIEALKARQQAVEDLQGDRNQPVYLMDELVKQTPEGVYLRAFKQDGQRVVINGYAQSNERVSEFLRNLGNNSPWLEHPDLIEIRSTGLGQGKDAKKVFDFNINVGIKRPRDKEQVGSGGTAVTAIKGASASATSQKP
jgi:type IV pilus assembly protein PilN